MKAPTQLLLVIMLSLYFLATCTGYSQGKQGRQSRWEYKFVEYDRGLQAQNEINNFAGQGWELVTVEGVVGSDRYVFFLKRELSAK